MVTPSRSRSGHHHRPHVCPETPGDQEAPCENPYKAETAWSLPGEELRAGGSLGPSGTWRVRVRARKQSPARWLPRFLTCALPHFLRTRQSRGHVNGCGSGVVSCWLRPRCIRRWCEDVTRHASGVLFPHRRGHMIETDDSASAEVIPDFGASRSERHG